jgi:hypothetical protein
MATQSQSQAVAQRRPIQEHAARYAQLAAEELPTALGFSARLNMLFDLSNSVPSQTEGRITSIMALNSEWREVDVRKWLQKDVLPPPLELRNLVTFLVEQLEGLQDVRHWEAFLVYGSPVVASPVNQLMYREDQGRRRIATMIFAQITDKYDIPPSSYQAEQVFQRCLTFMHKLNIYELHDFQPGHMEPFKNYMFPGES